MERRRRPWSRSAEMAGGDRSKEMSRLEAATTRLNRAIERLEQTLQQRARYLETASTERGQLEAALEATRRDYALLSDRADTVAARLDAAIGRLRASFPADGHG